MRPDGGSSPRVEQDLGQEQGHRPLPGARGSDRESLQPVLLAALESAAGTFRHWRRQSWFGRRLPEHAGLDLDEARVTLEVAKGVRIEFSRAAVQGLASEGEEPSEAESKD